MHDRINDIIKIIENEKDNESVNLSNNEKIHLIYDNIELISYNENNKSSLYGKGYGERDAIKYAINNSKLIDNNFIIKITGRYYIWNLDIIDKYLKCNTYVACKYMSKVSNLVDTRLIVFNKNFFNNYLQNQQINDKKGISMEKGTGYAISEMTKINPNSVSIIKSIFKVEKTKSGMGRIITSL